MPIAVRPCLLLLGAATIAVPGAAQTIDFETLPDGTPTVDLQEISTQYAAPPFGVSFRVIDPATGQFVAFPKLAKVGPPRTAFQGCPTADQPLANAGACETFLTDDETTGNIGSLEVTYTTPVPRATASLLDVDAYNGVYEQWTITAYDATGAIVDSMVVDPPAATPCGPYPGNAMAVAWSVESPTGAAEIVTIVLDYTGTAPVWQIGLAFDNFSPSEAGIGAPVTGCDPVSNSTGTPALVFASGSDVVADNLLRLRAQGLPPNATGFFLTSLATGNVMNPGGSQGTLCLGGHIGRLDRPGQVQNGGPCGLFDLTLDLTNVPTPTGPTMVMVGETRSFQCWYRDANPGLTSNFSDAVSIVFR